MDSSELRMNLASLQRIDPYIQSIVESSSQVALYRYIDDEWVGTETVGTLFVYERKCEPKHGFLILNRLSPDNWVQPITEGLDSQINPPFILYKTKNEILGVWFYEESKCKKIGKVIGQFIKESEAKATSNQKAGKMDLSSLLTKATNQSDHQTEKRDINLKTAKESPSSGGEKLLRMLSAAANKENDAKKSNGVKNNGDVAKATGPSSSSVVQFFAQAQQMPNVPAVSGPPPTLVRPAVVGPVPGVIPIMHGVPPGMALLPQQPGAPPVLIPLMRPPGQPHPPGMMPVTSGMQQPIIAPPGLPSVSQPHPHAIDSLLKNPGTVSLEALERTQREESCTPPAAPGSFGLEEDLKDKLNISGDKKGRRRGRRNRNKSKEESSPPAVAAVTSYASAVNNVKMKPFALEDDEPELMSPMVFSTNAPSQNVEPMNGAEDNEPEISPLTQGQLLQAMQHLLRTDKSFVRKLHQAYVESLTAKLN